ncbi:hypothetical protein [Erythrobacter dokdonensis]|uniref:Lipoprotein n=1 Tax=Erythrobacter dokdonensis DSW-74 TaxID=1300349 RepID=A0A1A7BBD7_9SPHN|nr:hypothetical protein [Erythrobacter dokdonensis]OBV09853.1 hypothetical protein I603_2749 [Erythrobacter dokdonensis DSW-74]
MQKTHPLIAVTMVAAACAPVERDPDADPAAGAPEVRVVGEAQSCINRPQIRQTMVRSDRVIDFEMRGGKVYRNILPSKCPGISIERAFTYNTTIDQLCTPEIIYVLTNIGGVPQRGAGCGLGKFIPVEYVKDDKAD